MPTGVPGGIFHSPNSITRSGAILASRGKSPIERRRPSRDDCGDVRELFKLLQLSRTVREGWNRFELRTESLKHRRVLAKVEGNETECCRCHTRDSANDSLYLFAETLGSLV